MGRYCIFFLLFAALVLSIAQARNIPSEVAVSTNLKNGHKQVTDEKNIVFGGVGGYAGVGGVSLGGFPILGGTAGTFGGVGGVTGTGPGVGLGGVGGGLGGVGGGVGGLGGGGGGGAGGLLP